MRRFLFLDIDGVLANDEYIIKARLVERKSYYETLIDSERVKMLNALKDLGVEIVISSSWGNHNHETENLLHDLGLELEVAGVTEKFHKDWICRGVEIEKWLCDNTKYNEEYRYAIVDDDDDMLLKQVDHFVKVNRDTALTTQNVERLIEILK